MKDETIKALKDTVIQWKKEYEILDSIIEMKDAVIAQFKAENARLKSCLQEIKAIAEVGQDKYHNGLIIAEPILDLITKAEEE